MRRIRMGLLTGMLVACPGKRPRTTPPVDSAPPDRAADAAADEGQVIDGRYVDPSGRFEIPVAEGWALEPGLQGTALQMRIVQPDLGVAVEVWRFKGNDVTLRARDGCTWEFQSTGPFEGPQSHTLPVIGTCVPVDPAAPRIFGWLVAGTDASWQLEGHVPPDRLIEGLGTVRSIVSGFQLLAPSGS